MGISARSGGPTSGNSHLNRSDALRDAIGGCLHGKGERGAAASSSTTPATPATPAATTSSCATTSATGSSNANGDQES